MTALAPEGSGFAWGRARTPTAERTDTLLRTVPDFARYAVDVPQPGTVRHESTRALGAMLRDIYVENPTTFRLMCPDETNSNRLGAVFEVEEIVAWPRAACRPMITSLRMAGSWKF